MSTRDRLAAARANRSHTAQSHELSNMNSQPLRDEQVQQDTGTTSGFLSEVVSIQDAIERMNANVAQISTLHARIMNVMDQGKSHDAAQLDQLTTETRALSNEIKERIKALERFPPGPDLQMRKNRAGLVRSKFIEAIQNYQRVEQEYRHKSRQRVERQLKIVKPDATPEEVAAVAEGGDQQIFAQALTSTSRYGESRLAFREVQDRQQDLKKMEETLAQLAQLFADMAVLVDQQEETIDNVETTARHVEADTEKAGQHTWKAVLSARSYRKGRWICFGIFLLIIAVLAIVLGVVFGRK